MPKGDKLFSLPFLKLLPDGKVEQEESHPTLLEFGSDDCQWGRLTV